MCDSFLCVYECISIDVYVSENKFLIISVNVMQCTGVNKGKYYWTNNNGYLDQDVWQ